MRSLDQSFRSLCAEPAWTHPFSVCCLVTRWEDYKLARAAFERQGFDASNTEFLVCDNSSINNFDAYQAIRIFLREARGRYVVIAHQDAYPLEPCEKLILRLAQLEKHDPMWGVVGNAGVSFESWPEQVGALRMPATTLVLDEQFRRVSAIDENCILIRNSSGITVSADLDGYHLYGIDVCLVADRLGFHSYVIDYLWQHDSEGTIGGDFFAGKERLAAKLLQHYSAHELPTTCTYLCWNTPLWRRALATSRSLYQVAWHPKHGEARRILLKEGIKNPLFLAALVVIFTSAIPRLFKKLLNRI